MGNNLVFIFENSDMEIVIKVLKMIVLMICTYYTNFKISNEKFDRVSIEIQKIVIIILGAIVCGIIRNAVSYFMGIIFSILLLSVMFSKESLSKSCLTTTISLSMNYVFSIIAIIINFAICKIITINSDYINFIIISIIHIIIMINTFRIRKFKNGISFLRGNFNEEFLDLFILNISAMLLFAIIMITEFDLRLANEAAISLMAFSVFIFITIKISFKQYYKQKLLTKELHETKAELAKKVKEVEDLEAENISISKKSHTLAHKQKALEYKLEEMLSKTEISKEEVGEVRDRIKSIEKDLYKEKTTIELDKTEIPQIDDMLKYMQSECKKNKIDFELQVKGNIHYMTNNLITKDDLETLLADHIKNAIIAINHTDNVNRSILVRLGEIDGIYSLYIYDTGIEFEKETLENLGKKPSTTHKDEGGTGMGFMNTFDTLRKCNASIIIEEIGEPSKDNYTKAIIIKFDKKNEFKIMEKGNCPHFKTEPSPFSTKSAIIVEKKVESEVKKIYGFMYQSRRPQTKYKSYRNNNT